MFNVKHSMKKYFIIIYITLITINIFAQSEDIETDRPSDYVEAIENEYSNLSVSEEYTIVTFNNKKGVKDKNEYLFIPILYDEIISIYYPYFTAIQYNKYGLLNNKNKILIPFEYVYLDYIANDKVIAKKDEKYGLINTKNEIIIPFSYSFISRNTKCNNWFYYYDVLLSENDNILLQEGDYYGFADLSGKIIIDVQYDYICQEDSIIIVKKDGKWGALNQNGTILIPIEYDFLQGKDFFIAGKQGKYGYIDKNQQIFIPFQYDELLKYDDFFLSKKNNNWSFIDRQGKPLIKKTFKTKEKAIKAYEKMNTNFIVY
jgi:hypothetical protein